MSGKLLACLSGAAIALAGASGASAQSGSASTVSGLELEEVIVTAEKRDTNLQKTSISIQTYSGDQLKKEGKKRIDEIMEGVIGVQVQTSQVGSNFYMRGVENGTSVLIDGIYQNRGEVVRGGTLDVAQVEVARGTQSTNLGANAIAGAVSIVSNQPAFEYQASGTLELGNYHLLSTEGVLNVPLSESQAIRIAYSNNKRNGYISSGAGDSDLQNARLKYRWQATENLNIVLTGSHQVVGGNGVSDGVLLSTGHWVPYEANLAAVVAGTTTPVVAGSPYAGLNFNGITTATGASLGVGCTNSQITGSRAANTNNALGYGVIQTMGCPASFVAIRDGVFYWDRDNPWDDGYPADAWPNNPYRHTVIDSYSADINWNLGIGTLTITPSFQHATFKSQEPPRGGWMAENRVQNTRQFEARLVSPSDSKLTWAGGLYYYWTNNTGTFQNIILPGSTGMAISTTQPAVAACARATTTSALSYCYSWNNTDKSVQETGSAYADTSYPVTDTFRVNAGARYSQDWRSQRSTPDGSNAGDISGPYAAYDYTCSFLAAGYNPRTCVNHGSWTAFTYSTGVEYDVLQNAMLYGTYKTGYQPGALSATRPNGMTDKLELEQITVGFKSRWLDNKLQANIEAFDTTYHNRALTGAVPTVQLNDAVPTTPNTTNTCASGSAVYRVSKNADGSACVALNNGTPTIPKLKSTGVDLDIYFLPTSSDRIDIGVEWLKSDYGSVPDILTDYPTATQLQGLATLGTGAAALTTAEAQALADRFRQQVEAYQGLMLQNSAEWSATFNYQHEFRFSSGSSLTPKISGSYKSKYWSQSGAGGNIYTVNQALESGKGRYNPNGTANLAIQPSYSLFDFTTTWRGSDGKFTVTGYVKNIENEPIMRNTNGNANVTLAAPRTYGMTMSANF